jgi:hypothetical protein
MLERLKGVKHYSMLIGLIAVMPCFAPFVRVKLWALDVLGGNMPFRVFFTKDGPYIETDTMQEAVAIVQSKLEPSKKAAAPTLNFPKPEAQTTSSENVRAVFLGINENAKKFLLALSTHEKGVRGDAFAEETGIEAEKFGGILGGISKIAKNNQLKLGSLIESKLVVKGSERYRLLRPTALLLQNATKLQAHVNVVGY